MSVTPNNVHAALSSLVCAPIPLSHRSFLVSCYISISVVHSSKRIENTRHYLKLQSPLSPC